LLGTRLSPCRLIDEQAALGHDRLTRLQALTQALPGLLAANEAAAKQGGDAHMAAFQRMNDALIELNELQQKAGADLERMAKPQ